MSAGGVSPRGWGGGVCQGGSAGGVFLGGVLLLWHITIKLPDLLLYFYRPKRSFGQGNIFTRVCDSVHGGVSARGVSTRGVSPRGGLPGGGGGVCRGGVSQRGSARGWGGVCQGGVWQGGLPGGVFLGGSSKFSGGSSKFSRGGSPPEYGQRSAGTHPTGMHPCSEINFLLPVLLLKQ